MLGFRTGDASFHMRYSLDRVDGLLTFEVRESLLRINITPHEVYRFSFHHSW